MATEVVAEEECVTNTHILATMGRTMATMTCILATMGRTLATFILVTPAPLREALTLTHETATCIPGGLVHFLVAHPKISPPSRIPVV